MRIGEVPFLISRVRPASIKFFVWEEPKSSDVVLAARALEVSCLHPRNFSTGAALAHQDMNRFPFPVAEVEAFASATIEPE